MKKNILTFVTVMFSMNIWAQIDRSKIPPAGPPPKIEIPDPQSFQLKNGLKVFVVENHKLPRVSFSLTIACDPILEGDKASYGSMVGNILRRGTKTKTKDQLDESIDFIGASLFTSPTGLNASSLKKHVETLLKITSDVLLNPSFPKEELEKIKTQAISSFAAYKDDPDGIANVVQNTLLYGKNHPYGEVQTEKTIENVTIEDCKNYYNTYFKPNISYLTIVGDITKKEAKKLAKKYFGKWKKGEVPKHDHPIPKPPKETQVAIVDKSSSVQSILRITHPIQLKPGDPDAIKTDLMNRILGGGFSGRLFSNLRETYGYTYGARSSVSVDELVGSFSAYASVRNSVTDSAVTQFLVELNRIRDEKVENKELERMQNYLTGYFARQLEDPATIARFALNIARYNLPKDYYRDYLRKVDSVNINDIQEMANKYILPKNIYILAVGKADEIAQKLSVFGKVKYYDIYGEEYTPSKGIPKGLTAEKVIEKYIEAIGGRENLEKIKNVNLTIKASFGPQEMIINIIKKTPNHFIRTISVRESIVAKEVFDGKNIARYQMGKKLPSDQESEKDAIVESFIIPELKFKQMGIQLNLEGKERVEEQDAYKVVATLPSGKKRIYYYDVNTGLKTRETDNLNTPNGELSVTTDFLDYQEQEGMKFPITVMLPFGSQKSKGKVTKVEINKEIDDNIFKIE